MAGLNILTLGSGKTYTNMVALGISNMRTSGSTVYFTVAATGEEVSVTLPAPADGISITNVEVNASKELIITLSDNTKVNAGVIPTVKGDKGDPFKYSDFTPEQLDSLKGSDGFSPSAKIEKVGDTATITITDKDGTTTATIKDGQGGSGGGTADVPIEKIKVNGELQTPVNKVVDITVPSIEGLTKDADLATVAKSGDYEDLINKPIIPDITGLATETYVDNKVADYTKTADLADVATSGSYNDLADKPTIPSLDGYAKTNEIPSKVSELENDSNYLSSIPEEYVTDTELNAKGYLTEHQDISGKVDKVEGKSLISDTEIARLASVDNYDDTDIRTELAKKADTTSIPSKVSELTNDSNYQTAEQVNSTVTTEIAKVVADAPEDLNTLKEMSDWIAGHEDDASAMNSAISDNKTAIASLQSGKADKSEIPTTVAELTDSEDYAKTSDVNASIKTLQTDKANTSDLTAHTGDSVIHVTAENKTLWNTVSNKVNKEDGKALLADTDKTNYDDAVTKAHTHENKEVLDGITSDKVTAWDNKSEFSGSYNDLNDKPTIDAELSNTSENAIQNKVVTKEINKLYSDISFNDFDTATSGTSFTDAEDGNMIVTDWTKNLLNPTLETTTENGVTCTRNVDANGNPDGTYTLNGKVIDRRLIFFNIGTYTLEKNKTYKFIGMPDLGLGFKCYVDARRDNDTQLQDIGSGDIHTSKNGQTGKPMRIVIDGESYSDIVLNNVLIKPMITTDLSATYDDFVPYGGYEIQSCGKNLLDFDTWANNVHINGGEKIVSGNSIKITAKSNDCFTNYSSNATTFISKIKCKPNTTYTFSYKKECEEGVLGRSYLFENGNTNNMVFSEENTVTITTTSNAEFLTFRIGVQNAGDYITYYNLQLEKGSEPTPFEPYTGETITVTNETESPTFGLKSHKGITNIISPANVKCVYPTNESGVSVLEKERQLNDNKSDAVIDKSTGKKVVFTIENGIICAREA